jgi:hypothetical protein
MTISGTPHELQKAEEFGIVALATIHALRPPLPSSVLIQPLLFLATTTVNSSIFRNTSLSAFFQWTYSLGVDGYDLRMVRAAFTFYHVWFLLALAFAGVLQGV